MRYRSRSMMLRHQTGLTMEIHYSPADEAFRLDMRAALAAMMPEDIRERQRLIATLGAHGPDQRRWNAILDTKGWSVPNWPVEHGGPGWSALQRFIFEDEMHAAEAPELHWSGTHMVGPVLYTFGSPELQAKFLPAIRKGDYLWAQGFSEPGSGSDLASLRTNARREGDHYVVSGQKIWTSGAFEADWGFFLVKTDLTVKPQAGMSFLLIDMTLPGITVRRIPQINGEAHLCEVFLDNVIVPADHLVGEEGRGWSYAKFLLDHERTTSAFIFWTKRELRRVKSIAAIETEDGQPLAERPSWRARIARLEASVLALEWSVLRVLAKEDTIWSADIAASVLKVRGSELQQEVTQLSADLLGGRSLRYFNPEPTLRNASPAWPDHVPGRTSIALMTLASTIYGGTKQVQKNILAKSAFGL
jgi:alkylation response protein AidB-like acyl-CoA dehydrogenase